ncbi:MAG: DUF45 domain-containing protein [Deltaproteobacteria bacterium]|nr:DUF45 domain-containing protein [Deltaproteobacteria bacterium]
MQEGSGQRLEQTGFLTGDRGSVYLDEQCVHFSIKKNYRIKRSRLVASPDEGLVFETPGERVNARQAFRMICDQKDWVKRVLKKVNKKRGALFDIKQHKSSVLVLGREKILEVRTSQAKEYIFETADRVMVGLVGQDVAPDLVEARLTRWLFEKARRYFEIRVRMLGHGRFDISHVSVRDQKTLWGSCSMRKKISINWRLIMAPRFASDYIIIHELCHTHHMNHSAKYWERVKEYYPAYREAEQWFKKYGALLHVGVYCGLV